jgi:hypothetical protein
MARTLEEILSEKNGQPEHEDDKQFFPNPPADLAETGLNAILIEDLICKLLLQHGLLSGKELAQKLCLPLKIFEDLLYDMKQRLILVYQSTAGVNDFTYALSEKGRQKGLLAREFSAYIGPAPVVYYDYLRSVERQSIQNERPGIQEVQRALDGLVLPEDFCSLLGPAINSGRGVFLYGEPGNGKTEVAMRIARCFQETIFIPKTLLIEGELVKLNDPQWHVPAEEAEGAEACDRRWLRIERPAVVVGGEMDMASLEIGYNAQTKVCEASLQMKGNCGVFAVDDFGRQKVGPEQLLNRWILPLEKRIDYLTLPSGGKFQVPFNALLVFCTNIDPVKLLDEAFLRRIPYKIQMQDPTEEAFLAILQSSAAHYGIEYSPEMAEYLLASHFRGIRPMRGCHPRDILQQLVNISLFTKIIPKMRKNDLDRSVELYFTATQKA